MKEMTSKERMLAAVRRQPVDYVPCSPFLNPQDWVQRLGKTYNFPFGPSREETIEYGANVLGLDMLVPIPWQSFFAPSDVSASVRLDAGVLTKTWHTPAGDLTGSIRYDDRWPHGYDIPFFTDYSIGRFVKPWLVSEADLECIKCVLKPPTSRDQLEGLRFWWENSARLAEKYHLATMVTLGMGLTGAHQICDSERLCLMVIDNPELVDSYLEVEHRLTIANYEMALDLGVDIVRRNGFYESCDFFSPDLLQRFLQTRINKEAEVVHQAGSTIGYTVLTGYTPMLDHLDSLDLDSIIVPDPFFEGEDPRTLMSTCGHSKSFWTGPSDTIQLPWDDQAAVRKAVETVFSIYGKTGLIVAGCSSIKAVHPWANTLAMVDAWKQLR